MDDLVAAPGGVGGQATHHPGRDADGDAPIPGPPGASMRDLVAEDGVDLVDPCAPVSCRLRGDAPGTSCPPIGLVGKGLLGHTASLPGEFVQSPTRPSLAAPASSQREASRPNSSRRPRARVFKRRQAARQRGRPPKRYQLRPCGWRWSSAIRLSPTRSILPVGLSGISSRKTISSGAL
jgi:hypothetical protein